MYDAAAAAGKTQRSVAGLRGRWSVVGGQIFVLTNTLWSVTL